MCNPLEFKLRCFSKSLKISSILDDCDIICQIQNADKGRRIACDEKFYWEKVSLLKRYFFSNKFFVHVECRKVESEIRFPCRN